MRTVTTILAAAAIAVAPIAIFTMGPASAAICSGPESTGQVTPSPACLACIVANPPGANAMRVCDGINPGAPVNTGCPGLGLDANGCANHIARCAAGTGPCPY
jgi:hypothetical protein